MTEEQLEKGYILKSEINYAGENYLFRAGNLGDGYIGEAVNYLCKHDELFSDSFRKLAKETYQRLVEEFDNL